MNIYISGISGTGMGPLALMAKEAGMTVWGSDLARGAIYDELVEAGIEVRIGEQDGEFFKSKMAEGVDWFVYTSALPEDHAELVLAREAGLKVTKRDDLTAYLVEELGLKMVAVAGTHGKTTTVAMIVYAAKKLGLPVSYIVGTTLGFAPSGAYDPKSQFFVYEADEYDRNFLKFYPWLTLIMGVDYDHPDIYPTWEDYVEAFEQFMDQSENVIDAREALTEGRRGITLAGEARRIDAQMAAGAVGVMMNEAGMGFPEPTELNAVINGFPGVGRRFERLAEGIYTDYAHHPEEIAATMDVALDECKLSSYKGVVVVYQPHQNTRQYEVRHGYKKAFKGAEKVYWLPTYLTRENPDLKVLTPEELIKKMKNAEVAEPAELGEELFEKIQEWRERGYLVILMTAGPADGWLRGKLKEKAEF